MGKIEKLLLTLVYIGINSLFIFKYGVRQNYIGVLYLLVLFPLVQYILYYFINQLPLTAKKGKLLFFITVFFFFSITIVINVLIDGNSLNVDRWSAMEVSIAGIFDGKYPYMQSDHMNGRSSNLPGLLFMGIPFYLLGNIGFLQSFTFLLFAYTLNRTMNHYKSKILGLLFLITSLFYLWEVYVKSDLMSNFIIILCFIVLWYKKYGDKEFKHPFLLGILSSFVLFTRLISIIPISIFLFKEFSKSSIRKKTVFLTSSILTVSILSIIALKDCPSWDVFYTYNPISLQNRNLPFAISLIMIVIPFFYSKKWKALPEIIRSCMIFIFIPIFLSFSISHYKYKFDYIIYNSVFDISYFNIFTPFLIYYITLRYDMLLNTNSTNI